MIHRHAVDAIAVARLGAPHVGVAIARGLHPNKPAAGSGDADRTQTVTRVGQRHDPRGGCRCSSATRTPGNVIRVPGIAAGAEKRGFGSSRDAEFRCIGLAEDHDPGRAVALDEFAVLAVHFVLQEVASTGARHSRHLDAEILDQKRNTLEGAFGKLPLRIAPRLFIGSVHHCVQGFVVLVDPRDGGIDQFRRAHFLAADEIRQPQAVVFRVVVDAHFNLLFVNGEPESGLVRLYSGASTSACSGASVPSKGSPSPAPSLANATR